MKKKTKNSLVVLAVVLTILATPFLIWGGSLLKCEVLTRVNYDDFESADLSDTMIGEIAYFKILECSDDEARIYYVEKDNSAAYVVTFEKQEGEWVEKIWDCIWVSSEHGGNASEVIYPYWWHFIYGGF